MAFYNKPLTSSGNTTGQDNYKDLNVRKPGGPANSSSLPYPPLTESVKYGDVRPNYALRTSGGERALAPLQATWGQNNEPGAHGGHWTGTADSSPLLPQEAHGQGTANWNARGSADNTVGGTGQAGNYAAGYRQVGAPDTVSFGPNAKPWIQEWSTDGSGRGRWVNVEEDSPEARQRMETQNARAANGLGGTSATVTPGFNAPANWTPPNLDAGGAGYQGQLLPKGDTGRSAIGSAMNPFLTPINGTTYEARLAGQGIANAEGQYRLAADQLRDELASRGVSQAGTSGIEAANLRALRMGAAESRTQALNDAATQAAKLGGDWELARAGLLDTYDINRGNLDLSRERQGKLLPREARSMDLAADRLEALTPLEVGTAKASLDRYTAETPLYLADRSLSNSGKALTNTGQSIQNNLDSGLLLSKIEGGKLSNDSKRIENEEHQINLDFIKKNWDAIANKISSGIELSQVETDMRLQLARFFRDNPAIATVLGILPGALEAVGKMSGEAGSALLALGKA